ncbi:facilitated trehalose transporter Tret1 [Cherax quadricarinatus]
MDALGPRMTLMVTAVPCLLSWSFIAFANSVALIYVGRLITGVFLGIFSPVPQVYATEIAEPSIRGMMGAFPEAAVALGSLLCYAFGSVVDWRWLAGISALVPSLPLFVSMVILPESPQWLTKKAKLNEAEKSLRFFRKKSHNVKAEVDIIYENITATDGAEISIWEQCKLFRKPQNWKPVLIVFLVFMCGQFSGFAVVTAYTVDIFNEANTNIDSNTATVIVGLVRFISTLVSAVLLDRLGRKPLLIVSSVGSCVGMVSIGVFFYLKQDGFTNSIGWLPLASLLIYVFFNELGYGPIPWLLSGELIPLAVRTIGNGVAVTAYSLFAFVIGLTFPLLMENISTYIVFWLYGLFSLSGVALGIFLPETRGRTLEEIEKFFAPKTSRSEAPLIKDNIP